MGVYTSPCLDTAARYSGEGLGACYLIDSSFQLMTTREFPKIGDPNIVPKIVGSLLSGPQNKVPLIFGNSHKSLGLLVVFLWFGVRFGRVEQGLIWGFIGFRGSQLWPVISPEGEVRIRKPMM